MYIESTCGSGDESKGLLACWLRQRHGLNPDFKEAYAGVVKWYLEVEKGKVLREIGVGADGAAVAIAPFGRNDGVWGGVPLVVSERDGRQIDRELFQRVWDAMAERLKGAVPEKIVEPVRPVEEPEVLHGLWTTGSGDSMSEDLIAFLPGGEGFFEVVNVSTCSYDTFEWRVAQSGRIVIRGLGYFWRGGESESSLQLEDVRAEIEKKHMGDGSSFELLSLRPLTAEGKRPEGLYFPREVYRCPVAVDQIRYPSLG